MSQPPEDYVDMIRALHGAGCEFIIVGAYALAANGHPRATQDIDILVKPDPENSRRVYRALVDFGAPIQAHGVSPEDFAKAGNVYQIGLPPVRIDILTSVDGLSFEEATADAMLGDFGGESVRFIGIAAQIVNKRAAGRMKDLADAEALEAIQAAKSD